MNETFGDGYHSFVYTPLTAGIVMNKFKIPTAPYEPGANSTMLKITDDQGHNAGYHTFVSRMMATALKLGVRVFYHHTLIRVDKSSSGSTLIFENGKQVTVPAVMLNLPQLPLHKVLGQSRNPFQGVKYPAAVQAPLPVEAV